ncbi:MAG: hypothetical protein JXA37_10650 [Chloroflexia bacterium]|nr:hypothetical protein [Chloroflexia bacterium]
MMNAWWLAAGIVGLITALIHLIGGQIEIIRPFSQSDLAAMPRGTLHACWHMVTVILFASAGIMLYLGASPQNGEQTLLALFIGGQFVAYALVFLVLTLAGDWDKKLIRLPQWMLLLPIGLLSIIGALVA